MPLKEERSFQRDGRGYGRERTRERLVKRGSVVVFEVDKIVGGEKGGGMVVICVNAVVKVGG